jgi:hypothetical protein
MSSEAKKTPPTGLVACLVLLGASLGLAACPGSLDTKEFPSAGATGATGGCGDVPTQLLKNRCAVAGCHTSASPQGKLDLTADSGLTMRLVGVDSTSGTCTGKLIDKTSPDQSLLYTKCEAMAPCGSPMPLPSTTDKKGTPLSDAEKKCLLDWITSVAM